MNKFSQKIIRKINNRDLKNENYRVNNPRCQNSNNSSSLRISIKYTDVHKNTILVGDKFKIFLFSIINGSI